MDRVGRFKDDRIGAADRRGGNGLSVGVWAARRSSGLQGWGGVPGALTLAARGDLMAMSGRLRLAGKEPGLVSLFAEG